MGSLGASRLVIRLRCLVCGSDSDVKHPADVTFGPSRKKKSGPISGQGSCQAANNAWHYCNGKQLEDMGLYAHQPVQLLNKTAEKLIYLKANSSECAEGEEGAMEVALTTV